MIIKNTDHPRLFWFLVACLSLTTFSIKADEVVPSFSPLQPAAFIRVPESVPHVLISHLETGVLSLYARQSDGTLLLEKDMPVSIGKSGYGKQVEGDNKTPVGVYRITSHLKQPELDDFYGHAAYPINYPNAWDKLNKRTGYGIWVHAEPVGLFEKTRPLKDSNGCVVLSNNDIDALNPFLSIGYTPIVLTPSVTMTSVEEVHARKNELVNVLNQWISAWESLDSDRYLAFYAEDFSNLKVRLPAWKAYKKRVNGNKKFIQVNYSDLAIYAYPEQEDMIQMDFFQSYRSSNYQADGWKRLLWRKEEGGQRRIVYEG